MKILKQYDGMVENKNNNSTWKQKTEKWLKAIFIKRNSHFDCLEKREFLLNP